MRFGSAVRPRPSAPQGRACPPRSRPRGRQSHWGQPPDEASNQTGILNITTKIKNCSKWKLNKAQSQVSKKCVEL